MVIWQPFFFSILFPCWAHHCAWLYHSLTKAFSFLHTHCSTSKSLFTVISLLKFIFFFVHLKILSSWKSCPIWLELMKNFGPFYSSFLEPSCWTMASSNSSVCGSPMKEKLQHLSQVRNHGISNYSVQDRLWFLEAALCKPSSWSSRGPISSFKQVTVTAWQGQSKTTPRMISVSTPCSIPCRDSEQDTDSYRNLQPKYQSSDSQTWFVQMQVPCRHWYPLQELGAGVLQRVLSQCWGGRAPGPLPLSPGMRQIFGRCERGSYYWFLLCLLALGLYTPCLETSFNTYLN